MASRPGLSGLALAEIAAGVILAWSGIENAKIADTLKSLAGGKAPTPGPATATSATAATAEPGSPQVTAPSSANQTAWILALLAALGALPSRQNVESISSWIAREGGGGRWNPLNTTLPEPGSTALSGNPDGVQNYANVAQGLAATVATLEDGYPQIIAALRSGAGLCGNASVAGDLSKWSGGGYSSVC